MPTKTITIRDFAPALAGDGVQVENELIITRAGRPVAKLVRVAREKAKRKRWNPQEHAARIKKIFGNKVFPSIDKQLAEDRADRKL